MNSEEKVAVYVKNYGTVAEMQGRKGKCRRNWQTIDDKELFWRSIFCSEIGDEEWEAEDSSQILEILNKKVWYYDRETDKYVIEEVLWSLDGEMGKEGIFVKLAYIALLGDGTKRPFIKDIIDIVYHKKKLLPVDEAALALLSQQVGAKWGETLNSIFETHFGKKGKYKVILDELFRTHSHYLDNIKNQCSLASGFFAD